MTPTTRRAGLALGLTIGLLAAGAVTTAPASHAESTTVADLVGDVVVSGDEQVKTALPDNTSVDVVATTFDYRRQFLVIRAQARSAERPVTQEVRVRTGGLNYQYGTDGDGRVFASEFGAAEMCRGAVSFLNPETATYRIRIPSRCFGSPDSIRVGFALTLVSATTPGSLALDDAVEGPADKQFTRVDLGPRLTRA